MSEFPILVEKSHWEHKGGTKEYTIIRLENALGNRIIVNRYGKVGRAVNVKLDLLDKDTSDNGLDRAFKKRVDHGYAKKGATTAKVDDRAALIAAIGGPTVWAKLGPDAIKQIAPSVDVSGMKPVAGPEYDEDGRKIEVQSQTAAQAKKLLEENARIEAEKQRNVNIAIPGFGRF